MPEYQRGNLFLRLVTFLYSLCILFTVCCVIQSVGESDVDEIYAKRIECLKECQRQSFPLLSCGRIDTDPIHYDNHVYSDLFLLTASQANNEGLYESCLNSAFTPYEQTVCFPSCTTPLIEDENYSDDTRPPCADPEKFDLLCVFPSDRTLSICPDSFLCVPFYWIFLAILIANPIQVLAEFFFYISNDLKNDDEETELENEYQRNLLASGVGSGEKKVEGASGGTDTATPSPAAAALAPETEDRCCIRLKYVLILYALILLLAFSILYIIRSVKLLESLSKVVPLLYFFFIAFAVDQIKSILVQYFVWIVFIKRCNSLQPGIQHYNMEFIRQFETEPSLLFLIRNSFREVLEKKLTNIIIMSVVGLYSIIMLGDLVFGDLYKQYEKVTSALYIVDVTILSFFLLEVAVKLFVYGVAYLMNFWSLIDAVVVIVCFVFSFSNFSNTRNIGMLRTLRLIRIFMIFRKVNEGRKKLKSFIKLSISGTQVSSYVEKALLVVENLRESKLIPPLLKTELLYVYETIMGNKLYDVSVIDDIKNTPKEEEVQAWLNAWKISSTPLNNLQISIGNITVVNRNQSRFTRSTFGSQAMSEIGSKNKSFGGTTGLSMTGGGSNFGRTATGGGSSSGSMIEDHGTSGGTSAGGVARRRQTARTNDRDKDANKFSLQLYTLTKINREEETLIEESLTNLDTWKWDAVNSLSVCQGNFLKIVFVKLLSRRDFIRRFSLVFEKIYEFANAIEDTFTSSNGFHTALQTANCCQCMYYLLYRGYLNRYLTHVECLIALITPMFAFAAHPCVSNEFLIQIKHPLAYKYNDQSILEHHSLAVAFNIFNKDNCNFLGDLAGTLPSIKQVIATMVLSIDMNNMTSLLSVLRTKISGGDFPNLDKTDDRQILLNCAMKACDVSFIARPFNISSKIFEIFMNEKYQQGEMEKKFGFVVSSFCDKELTNAVKCQLGFMDILVQPFLYAFLSVLPGDGYLIKRDILEEGLENNKKILQNKLEGGS